MKDASTPHRINESVLQDKQRMLAQSQASMNAQRADLARMIGELRTLQEAIKIQQGADVQALLEENAQLRQAVTELERAHANASANSGEDPALLNELKTENELLHQLLREKDEAVAALNQQLSERNAQDEKPTEPFDPDSFEADLRRERRAVDEDRAKLKKELEHLRMRNEELDEATREMEMAMSKERAEFARERIRLDRLREEIRTESERLQREAGVRENLAPVNKLREELNSKKGSHSTRHAV